MSDSEFSLADFVAELKKRRAAESKLADVTTFLRDLVAHKFAGSLPADVVAAEAEVLLAKIEVKP